MTEVRRIYPLGMNPWRQFCEAKLTAHSVGLRPSKVVMSPFRLGQLNTYLCNEYRGFMGTNLPLTEGMYIEGLEITLDFNTIGFRLE